MELFSESESSTHDFIVVVGVFATSFVITFSLAIFAFLVFYYFNIRNIRLRRTIITNPTYIALDPLKYSHIFAEENSEDGIRYYPYPINKKIY